MSTNCSRPKKNAVCLYKTDEKIKTYAVLQTKFELEGRQVLANALSKDSSQKAVIYEGVIKIYDNSNKELVSINSNDFSKKYLFQTAISPDSKILAVTSVQDNQGKQVKNDTSGMLRLYEIKTGRLIYESPINFVSSHAFELNLIGAPEIEFSENSKFISLNGVSNKQETNRYGEIFITEIRSFEVIKLFSK